MGQLSVHVQWPEEVCQLEPLFESHYGYELQDCEREGGSGCLQEAQGILTEAKEEGDAFFYLFAYNGRERTLIQAEPTKAMIDGIRPYEKPPSKGWEGKGTEGKVKAGRR